MRNAINIFFMEPSQTSRRGNAQTYFAIVTSGQRVCQRPGQPAARTAADREHLARQMARADERRAASHFHQAGERDPARPLTPRELAARFTCRFAGLPSRPM
jgi:hypothetical protein